jgi:hypothetical protein
MKAYRMKSWWYGRFVVKLLNGYFYDQGEKAIGIKEDKLVEYDESKDGIVAAIPYLEGREQEWLEEEYKKRVFKQIGENEWQQL